MELAGRGWLRLECAVSIKPLSLRKRALSLLGTLPNGATAWELANLLGLDPASNPTKMAGLYSALRRAVYCRQCVRVYVEGTMFHSFTGGMISRYYDLRYVRRARSDLA